MTAVTSNVGEASSFANVALSFQVKFGVDVSLGKSMFRPLVVHASASQRSITEMF
jgi:hypothetical protein